MVWTEPRIWVDGPHLTAAQMNEVSANLRETAPAKAEEPGDIFYATGPAEIARLPLGKIGQFLVPAVAKPQWEDIPSPIKARGDLIVGGPDGRPVRLPSVDGVAVLINDGAELRWATTNTSNLNIGIAERWWELEKWWSDSEQDDLTIASHITVPELVARDITFSGGFVDCLYSVCIIRCRTLRLSSHTTIVCKNRIPTELTRGSTDGGTSDGNPGGSGGFLGGGGGGGGDNGDGSANGGNGASSVATGLPHANLRQALTGDAVVVGGGSGGNGEDLARVRTSSLRTLGGAGGGTVVLAANEIITGGFNFRVDCSGDNGNDGLPEINFGIGHGGGGGGGGGTVIAVARTGHSNVQPNVNGGRGGGGADGVPTGTNFGSNGGDGGRGFSYVDEAFPTAQTPA